MVNSLKVHTGAKLADGKVLALATKENAVKETFDKIFAIPLDSDFFMHPVYPNGLRIFDC